MSFDSQRRHVHLEKVDTPFTTQSSCSALGHSGALGSVRLSQSCSTARQVLVHPAMRYEEALRIAEERDRSLRKTFDRFDIDGSGTIDMEELLALMDDMGLLRDLKSDPVDFASQMFARFDVNDDGVLDFEEFKQFHNAAKDDAAGRQSVAKGGGPVVARTVSGLSAEQQAARRKVAEEKARKKALEADRIRKENAALKARLKARAEAGGADQKSLDAEYEAARRELAKQRAETKAREAARIEAENAALKQRIGHVSAATENHLSGAHEVARMQAEKERLANQAAEKQRLLEHAQQLAERTAAVQAVTVNQLSAEENSMRQQAAKQAAEARDARLAAEREAERAMKAKLNSIGAATVNALSPEEEELRRQTAARIEAQNQAKAQAIAEQNLQMSQRLGSAQSMNPK